MSIKNFLLLEPDIAVILNSEPDHIECYGSEAALKQAYIEFADRAEAVVSLYCDLPIKNSVSFGFDKSARYYAKNIRVCGDDLTFVACEGETELGVVKLKVHGKHNVLNALAAIAAARAAGIGFDAINKGLGEFIGVERRFEKIGEVNGAVFGKLRPFADVFMLFNSMTVLGAMLAGRRTALRRSL